MSLAYRDDMFDDWKEIAHAMEIRKLKCTFGSPKVRGFDDAGGEGCGIVLGIVFLSFLVLPRSMELFSRNLKMCQLKTCENLMSSMCSWSCLGVQENGMKLGVDLQL